MMAVDLAAARKLLEKRDGEKHSEGGGNSNNDLLWYNIPKDGECKFRVAPPYEGAGIPGKLVYKHYNIPEKDNCTCMKTWDEPCEICDTLKKYEHEADIIADYTYGVRSAVNVEVISDPRNTSTHIEFPPDKWHILMSGDYTLIWLIEKILDPDAGDVTDPKDGHDVIFKRKKFNGQIDRSIALRPRPIAATNEVIQDKLNNIPNLDKIWRTPDDNFRKYVAECAILVENAIKLSLNTEKNPVTASINPNLPESVPMGATASTLPIPPKNNHPDCWGKHNESDDKCIICPQESQCQEYTKDDIPL